MKKAASLLSALILFIAPVFAQGVISGIVIDDETKLPLEGASVFAQNTTSGTITKKDGSYRIGLNKGGYEIVISFTGYVSRRINVEANGEQVLDVSLQKEIKSMEEVVITSSNEVSDGWEKYGAFFIDHFIGKTANASKTQLQNPEALKFYYYKKSDRLKVLAIEPLKISNDALGYDLVYNLDSFVYYNKTSINSYRGNCLYLPKEGDESQQAEWKQARKNAYYGSRLHFLRAYYDSSLNREGFTVDILADNSLTKFNRLRNPYDTTYYMADENNIELWFPKKASITYEKLKPEPAYLTHMNLPADVKLQISYVDLSDPVLIMANGFFTEQSSWINQGYWGWKNLADQLPYDYDESE